MLREGDVARLGDLDGLDDWSSEHSLAARCPLDECLRDKRQEERRNRWADVTNLKSMRQQTGWKAATRRSIRMEVASCGADQSAQGRRVGFDVASGVQS